jgi:hypothetical protein
LRNSAISAEHSFREILILRKLNELQRGLGWSCSADDYSGLNRLRLSELASI